MSKQLQQATDCTQGSRKQHGPCNNEAYIHDMAQTVGLSLGGKGVRHDCRTPRARSKNFESPHPAPLLHTLMQRGAVKLNTL